MRVHARLNVTEQVCTPVNLLYTVVHAFQALSAQVRLSSDAAPSTTAVYTMAPTSKPAPAGAFGANHRVAKGLQVQCSSCRLRPAKYRFGYTNNRLCLSMYGCSIVVGSAYSRLEAPIAAYLAYIGWCWPRCNRPQLTIHDFRIFFNLE